MSALLRHTPWKAWRPELLTHPRSILVQVEQRKDPGCSLRAYMNLPVSQFVLIEASKIISATVMSLQRVAVLHNA